LGGFRGFRAAWINLGNSIKSIFWIFKIIIH
jgi:hypothetical protein